MWEAAEHAAFYELDNLTAIVDVNRLGQRGETMHGWDLSSYSRRLEAFGWHAIEIDGHDVEAIDAAYREAQATTGRPTAIVARTVKGKGYSKVENENGWHGKPAASTSCGGTSTGPSSGVAMVISVLTTGRRDSGSGSTQLRRYVWRASRSISET